MPGPDDDNAGVTPVQNYEPARRHVGTGPDSDGDGLSDDRDQGLQLRSDAEGRRR
ncbi:MAG: hypothetical protein M3431_12335 [Actinomycetota bacterium]|nr:hypothetical protein [Actinomycetota bacterium]